MMENETRFRTQYTGIKVQLHCPEPTLTDQSQKMECDIDTILRKYDQTGLLDHVNRMQASYGDYSEVNEYQESLNLVLQAQDQFADLPAHIRKKFANDPGTFLEYVTDPDNIEACIEMGLIAPVKDEVPEKPREPANRAAETPENTPSE